MLVKFLSGEPSTFTSGETATFTEVVTYFGTHSVFLRI